MGLFITFEGGEGCGKSSQSQILYNRLCRSGIPAVLTYEPGGTVLGDEIRCLLKRKRQDVIFPETELFLFAACRFQLVTELIRPGLLKGEVVICDRFADSTIAYQGYGRGINLEIIKTINSAVTQDVKPQLTILLDMPVEEGLRRKRTRSRDRFEGAGLVFHRKVRNGYLELAADEPGRWLVIDATLSKKEISHIVWSKVNNLLDLKQDKLDHG